MKNKKFKILCFIALDTLFYDRSLMDYVQKNKFRKTKFKSIKRYFMGHFNQLEIKAFYKKKFIFRIMYGQLKGQKILF